MADRFDRPRVVALVGNPAVHDSRVRREAEALASDGFEVTLLARWDGRRARQERVNGFEIVRLDIPRLLSSAPAAEERADHPQTSKAGLGPLTRFVRRIRAARDRTPLRFAVRRWVVAARGVVGTGVTVFHAHDLDMLPLAVRLARRESSAVVYDSHELHLGSRSIAPLPLGLRRLWWHYERRLVRKCAGVITVNEGISDTLHRQFDLSSRPTVVRNCPPRWRPGEETPRTDHLRVALGIPAHQRIVIYVGGLQRDRGIEMILEVMRQGIMPGVVAVFLGYGPLKGEIEEVGATPELRHRVFAVDAVLPDELIEWVASADLSLVLTQPTCENNRLSSPNKLFESLAAGTPVVASQLPEIERVLGADGSAGILIEPSSTKGLASAIRKIMELSPPLYAQMRDRARQLALDTYNWETEVRKLTGLFERFRKAGRLRIP